MMYVMDYSKLTTLKDQCQDVIGTLEECVAQVNRLAQHVPDNDSEYPKLIQELEKIRGFMDDYEDHGAELLNKVDDAKGQEILKWIRKSRELRMGQLDDLIERYTKIRDYEPSLWDLPLGKYFEEGTDVSPVECIASGYMSLWSTKWDNKLVVQVLEQSGGFYYYWRHYEPNLVVELWNDLNPDDQAGVLSFVGQSEDEFFSGEDTNSDLHRLQSMQQYCGVVFETPDGGPFPSDVAAICDLLDIPMPTATL